MSKMRPSFLDSSYFVPDIDNWHLTEDAPDVLKKEFEEYMKQQDIVENKSEEDILAMFAGKKD